MQSSSSLVTCFAFAQWGPEISATLWQPLTQRGRKSRCNWSAQSWISRDRNIAHMSRWIWKCMRNTANGDRSFGLGSVSFSGTVWLHSFHWHELGGRKSPGLRPPWAPAQATSGSDSDPMQLYSLFYGVTVTLLSLSLEGTSECSWLSPNATLQYSICQLVRGTLWKFNENNIASLSYKRWRFSQILWKKNCVYPCPTWFKIYVLRFCCKFAANIDFSSGGCQKLPNWVKITHQNAELLQLVRKIFCRKSWRKKITTYFTVLYNFKCIWA